MLQKNAKSQNLKCVTKLIFSNNIPFHINVFIFDVHSESLRLCADYTLKIVVVYTVRKCRKEADQCQTE